VWVIKSQLAAATESLKARSESPALDAEVLLAWLLAKPRSHLRAWPEQPLSENQVQAFQTLITQRHGGMPVAYLTGSREFWSRQFQVCPSVLIPRPDTECLVEQCLALIAPEARISFADLGTGSGAIAITLAAERPGIQVVACDNSVEALAVARSNASQHGVTHIRFYHSDWFAGLPRQRFDLIASNPPYLAGDDWHLLQGDIRFEPVTALVAPEQGLAAIATITEHAQNWLKPGGHLLIEHGYDQGPAVQALFHQHGYAQVTVFRDLSGQPRVVCGRF